MFDTLTLETTYQEDNSATGGASQAGSNANANSVNASFGANVSISQESPNAIAALNAIANESLIQGTAQVRAVTELNTSLAKEALNKAADALMPADSRSYDMVIKLAIAGVIALGLFLYLKKG